MDVENTKTALDMAHDVSLTAKAEMIAKKLHKDEAEVSQHVRGAVEVRKPVPTALLKILVSKVLGFKIYAYSHSRVQAIMLGMVLFMTVGMYNVIIFLGGAEQQTAYLANISNIALYTVFTVFCMIAPACLIYFGLRPTLCAGGVGYAGVCCQLVVLQLPWKRALRYLWWMLVWRVRGIHLDC